MNVNPEKIKELILMFSKLDDDYQEKLMDKAYELSFKQTQKNIIQKENKNFKNSRDFEKEINKRTSERLKESKEILDIFNKVGDEEKAELIVLLNKLSHGDLTKKTDIEIKINEERVSIKDYLEEVVPGIDFNTVNKNVENHLKELKEE